jgi:multicomponent Na+:H+ antiporter subunit B
MSSLILRTATAFLMTLLLLFSLFLLLRGHDEPGGGFVGGLVAAAAFCLYALAFDVGSARRALRIEPRTLIALGLLTAAASGVAGMAAGHPFLSGLWLRVAVPVLGPLHVGTPVVFDVGVYLAVLGVVLTIILPLAEE